MWKKNTYIIFYFFLLTICCNKKPVNDDTRINDSVKIMDKLKEIHSLSIRDIQKEKSIQRLDSLIHQIEKKKFNYPLLMAYVAYSAQGDSLTTIKQLDKSQKIANKTKDSIIKALNYQLHAKHFHIYNQRNKAFQYALLANQYSRNRHPATYDNSLSILSDIAFGSGNYKEALGYSKEILARGKSRNIDPIYTVEDYLLIALIYARTEEKTKAKKYFDSANVLIKKNKFNEVYLFNLVDGYIKYNDGKYIDAIDAFNREIDLLGYYNLLFVKKAKAFDHLGIRDSVLTNLKIIENSTNSNNIKYDYDGLREYFPLKIKYAIGLEKDSIIEQYAKFSNNALSENKTLLIQKNRHDFSIIDLEKKKNQIINKERSLRDAFLYSSIIFALIIVIIIYGIINKRKKLQLLLMKKEFDALQVERSRISRELHDDLGSNFTSISLARKLLESKYKSIEDKKEFNIIFKNTKDIYLKINEIVWSLDSYNNSVFDLIQFTKKFLQEFLRDTSLNWDLQYSESCSTNKLSLTTTARRQLILAIKEIVNNSLKHSEASHLDINFELIKEKLIISISDNGKGFDLNALPSGKGLKNIKKISERLPGSSIDIQSNPNKTTFTITYKTK